LNQVLKGARVPGKSDSLRVLQASIGKKRGKEDLSGERKKGGG